MRSGAYTEPGEEEPILPGRGRYSLWKGASVAKRLNLVGTVTCILDTSINLASSRSKAISGFFDETVPYYVSAIYYILPTAALLLYYLVTCPGCSDINAGNHRDEDKTNNDLIDAMSDVEGFADYLKDHPKARDEMRDKISKMQGNGDLNKIDIFINVIYFTLRALHGVILVIKANDLASKQTNDSITDWSDFASNVINVAYMMIMLIYNNFRSSKKDGQRHTFFGTGNLQQGYNTTDLDHPRISPS